jgi:ABC-type sugar transport system ATPase subunit
MTDAAIMAEQIGKRFGPVPALDGVDLVLPAGGVLGLLAITVPAAVARYRHATST